MNPGKNLDTRKEILCTLGPSSLSEQAIRGLEQVGVNLFRINMSHTSLDELKSYVGIIRRYSSVPICIDTEGAQVRNGPMEMGVALHDGDEVELVAQSGLGTASKIPLVPPDIVSELKPGTVMTVDFDGVLLRVTSVNGQSARATVLTGGEIGSRKAVTIYPPLSLPTFTEKDLQAIQFGVENGIGHYALSFCNRPSDVARMRQLVGPTATVIAKVESREGIQNLVGIVEAADAILIDRGDLSREVRIQALPLLQKAIIRRANAMRTPVYVATNLLESMVTRRGPTRAEVNDVINTLLDGADGLVLAAETAIGKYPVEAATMVAALIQTYEQSIAGYRFEDLLGDHPLANE